MSILKNTASQADLPLLQELSQEYGLMEGDLLKLLPSLGLLLDELDSVLDPGRLALLRELLGLMQSDLSLPEFLDNLDEAGFLYECQDCKALYLSSKLLLDEADLAHTCKQRLLLLDEDLLHTCEDHLSYSKPLGRLKLIATGSADRLRLWAHSKKLGLDRPFAGP